MVKTSDIFIQNEEQLKEKMHLASEYVFNLHKDLPIQVHFYYINGSCMHASIILHHICFDDWSRDVFGRELVWHYNAMKRNENYQPKTSITYIDYAAWERQEFNEESLSRLADFWRARLRSSEHLNLPTDFSRPSQYDYKAGEEMRFEINVRTTELLKELAQLLKSSLYRYIL